MKYIAFSIIFYGLMGGIASGVFAAGDVCGGTTGYATYECRVENICSPYASEKPVYTPRDYLEAEGITPEFQNQIDISPALSEAKKIYRENMERIYKCALLQIQKNTLSTLKETLKQETTGQLSEVLGSQIDMRVNRLDVANNAVGCATTDTQTIQNKLNVLRETTHEMCRYTSYLSYLESHYSVFANAVLPTDNEEQEYTLGEIPNIIGGITAEISQELDHTYQVFPIAYRAYSSYENNFPIHMLLEVVRGDFLVLRQQLLATLMPIAQLAIKVINATSY